MLHVIHNNKCHDIQSRKYTNIAIHTYVHNTKYFSSSCDHYRETNKIIRLYWHYVHIWFLLVILTSKLLYRYKFLRDVIFKVLRSTLRLWNFRPQYFICKTFSSHQSESRILVNTCIWHLQGMMARFCFISCSS